MRSGDVEAVLEETVGILRDEGAVFGYLHGSRNDGGPASSSSDIDVAAHFAGRAPQSYDVLLPTAVDLLVLDRAPLELAGRVAARGKLLFEDDPISRVRWESTTRKIYFDELPRIRRSHAEFAASVLRG